jgi:transposase-like protein
VGSESGRRYYGIAEIADALGVDRQLVTVWRRRLSRGMPPPDDELAAGPLWEAGTIAPWIERTRARMAQERSDAGPPPPELVRAASRRLLRLSAVLLEDAPDAQVLDRALRALAQLADPLSSHSGEGDPVRRLCGELATLATDAGSAAAAPGSSRTSARSARSATAGMRAECLRLLPTVAKLLSGAYSDTAATGPPLP